MIAFFKKYQEWISLVVRLGMAAIYLFAGLAKLEDIPASIRAVRAYEILPEALVPTFGTVLPYVEVFIGVLLLFGILTRYATFAYLALMAAFMFGLIWAWTQGLSIDCGCFGGGGAVEAADTKYTFYLFEKLGIIALGAFLWFFPRSKLSLDAFRASRA